VTPGTIALFGSGEMSPAMAQVHRAIMAQIAGPVRAVFLDTPAGFQLNVDQIAAKAVDYFQHNLSVVLSVASFKSAAGASPVEEENTLRKLRLASYIFAGPGSPTYTVRHWRDTAILAAMAERLSSGAHLVLASAAAITVGRYALPVYEIYKVGQEPHWVEGLDLLGLYGFELAIVPHWNNTEGGTHDTRYCFMGEPRLKLLEAQLPASAVILGIDEYTACLLDLSGHAGRVMGAGQVTIRHRGCESYYPAGRKFDLDELLPAFVQRAGKAAHRPETEQDPVAGIAASQSIAELLGHLPDGWEAWAGLPQEGGKDSAPFIDLLVQVRAQLRAGRQWALADEIRDRLAGLGIILEDGPAQTTWRKA